MYPGVIVGPSTTIRRSLGFDRCPVLVDDRHVGAEDGSTDGAEPSFRLSGRRGRDL